MATRTPEPRLPLEPEEYPLYQPPKRIGCSALTIVTLLTVAIFAFLVWRVTPPLARAITDFPKSLPIVGGAFASSTDTTGSGVVAGADVTPGAGGFTTQTVLVPTATRTPAPTAVPTATPVLEYVRVANTGGLGVRLRKEPKRSAAYDIALNEGSVLQIIGPDTPDATTPTDIWRHVQYTKDGSQGYVLSTLLTASPAPTPTPTP